MHREFNWNRIKNIAIGFAALYAALLVFDFAFVRLYGQTPAQALTQVLYVNITSASRLDRCDAANPCIDNRSQFTRQSSTSSYRAFGTGAWSVDMQYADGAPTGWVSFGSTAQVNQAGPSSGIGYGIGPGSISKSYHDYIRFVITGNATIMNYSGTRQFWWLPSVAAIAFPLTANQGGTFGVFYSDALSGTLPLGCTAAHNAGLTLVLSQPWTGLITQSLNCNIMVLTGGLISPASGQTVTLSGTVSAQAGQRIFDISAGGTVTLAIGAAPVLYPQWFGAVVDGTTNDDTAMNAALVAAKNGPPISVTGTSAIKNVSLAMSGNDRLSLQFIPGVKWNCKNSDNTTCIHINASSGNPVITISGIVLSGGDGTRGQDGCTTTDYGPGLVIDGASAPYLHLSNIQTSGFCHAGSSGVLIDGAENSDWIGGSLGWASDYGVQIKNVTSFYASNVTVTGSNSRNVYLSNMQGQFDALIVQGGVKTGVYANGLGASIFNNLYIEGNNSSMTAATCGLELHGDSAFTINNAFNQTVIHTVNETAGICTYAPSGGGIVGGNVFRGDSFAGTPHAVNLGAGATAQKFEDFSGAPSVADGADSSTVMENSVISPFQYQMYPGSAAAPSYAFAGSAASRGTGTYLTAGGAVGLAVNGTQIAGFDSNGTAIPISWTPALDFGGASTGITYGARAGTCYVVGRSVTITVAITLTSKGSATGAAHVTGLPGNCISSSPSTNPAGGSFTAFTKPGGAVALSGAPGLSIVSSGVISLATNGANGFTAVLDTNFDNTTAISFTATYFN